jgi:hypothetical protein
MNKKFDPALRLLCEGSSDIYFIGGFKDKVGLNHLKPTGEPVLGNLEGQGISYVEEKLPEIIKIPEVKAIGVVIDADSDKEKKWEKIYKIFEAKGKEDKTEYVLPSIQKEGIIVDFERFRFGLWFWPDNEHDGDLETLLEELISEDQGFPLAKTTVSTVLDQQLSELQNKDHRKAQIYTWLCFQEEPGRPFGQAI